MAQMHILSLGVTMISMCGTQDSLNAEIRKTFANWFVTLQISLLNNPIFTEIVFGAFALLKTSFV